MKFILSMRVIYISTEPLNCLRMIDLYICIIFIIGRKPGSLYVHPHLYNWEKGEYEVTPTYQGRGMNILLGVEDGLTLYACTIYLCHSNKFVP